MTIRRFVGGTTGVLVAPAETIKTRNTRFDGWICGVVVLVAPATVFVVLLEPDPVCGMRVDRARAVTATVGGRTHHFCSEACRDTFLSERREAGASTLSAPAHG